MWMVLLLISASVIATANCEKPSEKVVQVLIENGKQVQAIEDLQKNDQIIFWTDHGPAIDSYSMFSLPESMYESVTKKLKMEGMEPITVIEDIQSAVLKEKKENQPSLRETFGSWTTFRHNRYLTIREIESYLVSIASSKKRSAVTRLVNIGTSYENRNITGVKITSGKFDDKRKGVMFLECGIHAREWVSPAACLYMIDQLSDPDNLESQKLRAKYEWYIFPSTNPDGYHYSMTKDRHWRKSRSPNKRSGCIGTDSNRNFDIDFGGEGNTSPCDQTYCGKKAFSEKETQALRNILLKLKGRTKAYFAIHSFSQTWMYPLGFTDRKPKYIQKLRKVSEIAVSAIEAVHGKKYRHGTIPDVLNYKASGSSTDWAYVSLGITYSFAIELRPDSSYFGSGFMLPKEQIIPTGEEIFAGIKAAANAICKGNKSCQKRV